MKLLHAAVLVFFLILYPIPTLLKIKLYLDKKYLNVKYCNIYCGRVVENKSLDSSDAKRSIDEEMERQDIPVISSTLADLSTNVSKQLKSRNLILFVRTTDVPKNADEADIVRAMDFSYLENLIFAALKIYPKVILGYEISPTTTEVKNAINNPEMLRLLREKNNSEDTKAVLEFFIKLKETFDDKVEIEPIGTDTKNVVQRSIGLFEEYSGMLYRNENGTRNKVRGPAVIVYLVSENLEEVFKISEAIKIDTEDTVKIFVVKPSYNNQDEDDLNQDDLRGAKRE